MPLPATKPGEKTDWSECGLASLFADSPFSYFEDVEESLVRERTKWREAVNGLLEASKGCTLNGLRIKDLVNEGRP